MALVFLEVYGYVRRAGVIISVKYINSRVVNTLWDAQEFRANQRHIVGCVRRLLINKLIKTGNNSFSSAPMPS